MRAMQPAMSIVHNSLLWCLLSFASTSLYNSCVPITANSDMTPKNTIGLTGNSSIDAIINAMYTLPDNMRTINFFTMMQL